MIECFKLSILKGFSIFLEKLAINTVNSMCWLNFGQGEEPDSLNRFKKVN